jgi:hypothetical protein
MHSVENTNYKKKEAFLILCFYRGGFMKTKKRQKMCYNCEGEIDLDVIVCPFCAADLREEKPEQQTPTYHHSVHLKNLNTQQSLYPSQQAQIKERVEEEVQEEEEPNPAVEEEEAPTNTILPIVLMTLGSQLFLFGLLILLFSKNGEMTLKWSAEFWWLYTLASLPFLIFGYKAINKL